MSLAQSTLVQQVRNLLQDNPWATVHTANLSSSTSTTVAVPDGTKWDEGAILEFQDNGEQVYVRSVSSNNLTVIRGWNGTTATTHDGSGTAITIYRDPAFSFKQITDAVDLTMVALWPYVYKKVTATVTPSTTTPLKWYDLSATALALISVTQYDTATPARLYQYGAHGSSLPVVLKLNLPTGLVASGTGLFFPRGFATTASTVQVDYAAKLATTQTVSGTYDDLSSGLLADIIAYGVAARLVMATDIPRATQEDIGMGDSSVQVGMRFRIGQQLYAQFNMLKQTYWEELRRTMPLMGTAGGPTAGVAVGMTNGGGYINTPYP